ncbi:ATP-grasp domain-containing protein [Halobacillus litoralis]|uniref:ATP-grasp domain-containing protein n=1 Tax=Halobacillus litoralis TaxID=45668 RepID=UPI0013E8E00D|nr:ATP-grasp domain-containing protein [Halobacillus litoralis]
MNVLVCSAGRRVKVVQYLRQNINKSGGKVITVDCNVNAPALYFGDEFDIIPQIDNEEYLASIIAVCKKYKIKGILSLIDPELEMLAKNKKIFDEIGVTLVLSPLDVIQYCYDKQETYNYLTTLGIPAIPTFSSLKTVTSLIERKELSFPLVVKPGKGSASIGINIVNNKIALKNAFSEGDDLIIQPFYKDLEFGIDVYVDLISGDLVDMFIKEKVKMRSGETDKAISVHNIEIETLVKKFISRTGFVGPIDIDCFKYKGNYYISEINPRFGGGYPHAQEMGCDFMDYINNNLIGKENKPYTNYRYEEDFVMMKYDDVFLYKK